MSPENDHQLLGILLQVNNQNYIQMKFNHDLSVDDVIVLEVSSYLFYKD